MCVRDHYHNVEKNEMLRQFKHFQILICISIPKIKYLLQQFLLKT